MANVNKVTNAQLFNSIYSACSPNFQSRIPKMDKQNMAQIGMLITASEFQAEFNEWLNQAVNRIGLVLIRENVIENRLQKFIYGTMEFGDAIEELAVQVIKAEDYDMGIQNGSVDPFRISNPDVKALYHRVNSKKKYRVTTYPEQVKRAFLNEGGISRLFMSITQQLINGARVDDWLSMKEIFNVYLNDKTKLPIKDTQLVSVNPVIDETTGKQFISLVKNTFSNMMFPSGCFNQMGIIRQSYPDDMVLFIRADLANFIDVEVLASAFNRDDLDFTPSSGGRRVQIEIVDDFGGVYPEDANGNRLFPIYNQFGGTTGTYSSTEGGTTVVEVDHWVDPNEGVYAILADRYFLLITRQLERMETIWNPEGLYWNEFYHLWSQYGYTGFYNNVVFQTLTVRTFTHVPNSATVNTQVTLEVSGMNLSNGMVIDTGDGNKITTTGTATLQTATHTYTEAGTYEAHLEGTKFVQNIEVTAGS